MLGPAFTYAGRRTVRNIGLTAFLDAHLRRWGHLPKQALSMVRADRNHVIVADMNAARAPQDAAEAFRCPPRWPR